jgi:putative hydrolase of the HAD superfamily
MIKAVTVDLWGTLVVDNPAADERYRRERLAGLENALVRVGFRVPAADLARAYSESGRHLARIWRKWRDVPVERHVTLLLQAVNPSLPGSVGPEALAALVEAYSNPALLAPPSLDEGAAKALDALTQRGIVIGLVSNTARTPGAVLRTILRRHGVLERFKATIFSDECGIRKPDPAIFDIALKQLDVSRKETVHVGDDPVLDVEGARTAGLRVIQLEASGAWTARYRPDAVIERFDELPDVVADLDRIERLPAASLAIGRLRPRFLMRSAGPR